MARGEGEEAVKRLEELFWHYPTLRLDGRTTLLRCEAALLMGDWREAKKHADNYIDFATDRNYLPAVHMAAGDACAELGLKDEAIGHYRAILDKFKEYPDIQKAADALERLDE
jgi:tetratricopeptide (TPR) repeat protein